MPGKSYLHLNEGLGIVHAPTGRRGANTSDKDLYRWRRLLDEEYPLLTTEQITRSEQPHHLLVIQDLVTGGDAFVAQEMNSIFRKEERERREGRLRGKMAAHLKDDTEKLARTVDVIRQYHSYIMDEHYDVAILTRKHYAETLMHEGDNWLAKHFFLSCLQACNKLEEVYHNTEKIQAEVHCTLAYLARENHETLESALAIAIDHLDMCRTLSENQHWQFKPRVLLIKLQKPVALHGLRTEDEEDGLEVVDGCSMTLYMVATLLEHELLISLANQVMHMHKYPTDEDVETAHEFADHALKLAMEVRHPTAMSSALLRFGTILRLSGAFEDAINYFELLKQHCEVIGDYTSEAIAYHNVALCLIGCHKSVEALTNLAMQMDIAEDFKMKDLEADAMHEIGHLLLREAHTWEAEECYAVCYENFKSMEHTRGHKEKSWTMLALGAGETLWGRYASLCRNNTKRDTYSLLNFQCSRNRLSTIHRPNYRPEVISSRYPDYIEKMHVQRPPVVTEDSLIDYEQLVDEMELSAQVEPTKTAVSHRSVFFSSGDEEDGDEEYGSSRPNTWGTEAEDLTDVARRRASRKQSLSFNESLKRVSERRMSFHSSRLNDTGLLLEKRVTDVNYDNADDG